MPTPLPVPTTPAGPPAAPDPLPTPPSLPAAAPRPAASLAPSVLTQQSLVAYIDGLLSDAANLPAHATRHASGGDDPLTPADIGAATAAQGALADTAVQPNTAPVLDAANMTGIPSPATATESTEGLTEFATAAEVLAADGTTNDAVVRAKHLRLKVETGNGNAVSIGDLGGDARGSDSVTIQASRGAPTQVASGNGAVAIGLNTTASGYYSTALGYTTTAMSRGATASGYFATASNYFATALGSESSASGYRATAIGNNADASGFGSSASGYSSSASGFGSTASGYRSSASGSSATASGYRSSASGSRATALGFFSSASQTNSGAFGCQVKSETANVQELGYWSSVLARAGAVRVHGTGMVAMTYQDRATEYGASAAANGAEADNELADGMFAIRTNGNDVILDINIGGTVKNINLGTAA